MPDTLTNLLYHAVFATHERAPLIGEKLRPRLHAYIGGIVRSTGGVALEVGGTSDHAHLLARLPPGLSVSDAMRTLKSNSSRWMNQQLGSGTFRWQTGYAAFSVSESQVARVRTYIRRQDEHHRRWSLEKEMEALFAANEIDSAR
jgi:REP element-mobilizing transposase RayT